MTDYPATIRYSLDIRSLGIVGLYVEGGGGGGGRGVLSGEGRVVWWV